MGFLSRATQVIALGVSLALMGCSSGSHSSGASTYTVGGNVSGLKGSGLVLQLNGGNDLAVTSNGAFTFPALADGSSYSITVKTQPSSPSQTCVINRSSGVLSGANDSGVAVVCSWTKQFGVAGVVTQASATATDSENNVYVVGYTSGGLDGNTLSGTSDAFLIKYDATGARVYTQQLGVSGAETKATGVAVATNGDTYVVGHTTGQLSLDPLSGTTDFFLAKYNAAGNWVFTVQVGVAGAGTFASSVATDAAGNVYVAGRTTGSLPPNVLTGNSDLFLAKYDSSGNFGYLVQMGAPLEDSRGNAVAVDTLGNVYVAGTTSGGLDFNALTGTTDYFVSKFTAATGGLLSTIQMGAASAYTAGDAMTIDASNNIYIAGHTSGGLDINTVTGTLDLFVTKYDSGGTPIFTKQLGAIGADTSARSVATDGSGNVYVTGETYGNLDGHLLNGTYELFLAKYDSAGNKVFTKQVSGGLGTSTGGQFVATDSNSNVYVAGATDDSLNSNVLTGSTDAFLMKYDSSGVQQ